MAMRVLLFDGQGSAPAPTTPVPLARAPLASFFARQAGAAFSSRLAALSPAAKEALDTGATRSLLAQLREGTIKLPVADTALLCHPLVSLPSMYVAQVVRLLEELETGAMVHTAPVDVVGYSSGLLPALLVATSFPGLSQDLSSTTQLAILRNALALLDIAVLLGVEAQASKGAMLAAGGIALDDPACEREWSVVAFGDSRDALEAKLRAWNSQTEDALLWIHLTAQTTPTCHTLSGLPSTLRKFLASETLPSSPIRAPSVTPAARNVSATLSSPASFNGSESDSESDLESDSAPFHSLSRKSSALSFYTSVTSPSSSPAQKPVELHTPIPVVSLHADSLSTSNVTSSAVPISTPPAQQTLPSMTKPLGIFTLFHADVPHLRAARDRVLAGLFSGYDDDVLTPTDATFNFRLHLNGLSFAHTDDKTISTNTNNTNNTKKNEETCAALKTLRLTPAYTLYNTHTGCAVPASMVGKQLVERVLDMIVLERVEFARVLETISERAGRENDVEIMNFGPGMGLARVAMRTLKERVSGVSFAINDVSNSSAISAKGKPTFVTNDSQEPIAIVGMAVNFPGARDTSELWSVLENGINTVEEIPQTRFSISPYSDANPNANSNRKMKTRFGCFLPDSLHASFDNTFFRISPREARAIDPQMRVLMRVGMQAVEAAGLVVDEFHGGDAGDVEEQHKEDVVRSEDVGCFVGVATNDYPLNLKSEIGVHYATGTLPAFLAGRVAYALHLSGPSMVLNTACSSSLVAIHQACRALLAGDCKAALAGGVNVVTSPDMYLGLDRAHFLSPTGNCKPWDASADGYCRAEGCGMFVLKRLSDALASSDNILGVIRGTEANQSAAAVSITRPHSSTQATLFRTLLGKSGVRPEEVGLVEAHGTGTQAGDPEELRSLRDILSPNGGRGRSAENALTVTSIKANIGHAEAASGAASLAKVLLMLRHRAIPTQVSLVNLNPKIAPLGNDFTHINTTGACVEWKPNAEGRRVALVNNFGAAGSNVAMLVEEAPMRASVAFAKAANDQVLVALSAETEDALLRLRDAYIASVSDSCLVDFAYTATARRKLRPWRVAVAGDSAAGIAKALTDARPSLVSQVASVDEKKIVFVFSGQGGQHLSMGRQLYIESHSFRSTIDTCHVKLVSWGYPGVLAIIDPANNDTSGLQKDDELVAFQCAIFVLECALCKLWESWGVTPDAVVGHSLGEYAALVAAGVVSLDAGLRLVARRARLMTQRCQQGASGMLVVRVPAEVVSENISKIGGCESLSVACYNGAKEVVVGGPHAQLATLKDHLERTGAKCISVNVPFAYHTEAMSPVLDELSDYACKFDFKAPKVPIVSNVLGTVVQPGDASVFNSEYFAKHCRQPVRFDTGVDNLADELKNIGAFIELGPHPTTLPMISSVTSGTGATSLHSLHRKTTARSSLCTALSRMFTFCNGIVWGRVYRDLYPSVRCAEIPGYPLMETEFWVPYVEEAAATPVANQESNPLERFSFLESWTQKPSSQDGNISEFEISIEKLAAYISGHKVVSFSLCPASVYYELALSAATCTLEYSDHAFADALTLSEVQFTHPLVYNAEVPLVIRTAINVHPRGGKHAGTFSISSVLNGKEQHVHCTGFFQRRQKNIVTSKLQLHCASIERGKSSLLHPGNDVSHEMLHTRTIYDLIFPRVVQYSKLYQVISTMILDERNGEGFATMRIPAEQVSQNFVAHPVFVDTLLHAAGFLINSQASGGDAFICGKVDSTKMLFDIDYSATFEIYCTTNPASDGMILADAWAVQTGESRRVVAHMKRMRFSRLRLNSLNKLLSRSVDTPKRSASPLPFLKPFDRSASPSTPTVLGSPFRPTYRANTPSSMSSVTAVNSPHDLSVQITKLVAESCGVPLKDVNSSSNIADLGVDSLIWIELIGQLKSTVPDVSFEASELMLANTVGDLISKIAKVDQRPAFSFRPRTPLAKTTKPRIPVVPRITIPVKSDISVLSQVKNTLGKVLEIAVHDLRDSDSLDGLGLDSLGSIEALQELQQEFRISLPQDFFRECSTIDAVQNYIANALGHPLSRRSSSATLGNTDSPVEVVGLDRTLLSLQSSHKNGSSPLILVHDGSGLSHCYSRIGNLGRSLWGINNPKLISGESWKGGVAEMATHYVEQIKPIVTDEGCILGGWSFGGVVAFHMACELMRVGVKVAGVVLIDSPSPFTQKPLSDALIDAIIQAGSHTSSSNLQQSKIIQLARAQMSHATRALVAYDPLLSPVVAHAKAYPNVVMLRCSDPFPLTRVAGHVASESMPFFEDRSDPRASVRDWERLVGKDVPILDIPGHHFEPFAPKNVNALSEQLTRAIAHLEAATHPFAV
ncbi:polyketide synthase [Phellopilus nigrolimitatus]|nr:polyketide synthase [Phellopilus nigrolimitatus]